MPKYIRPWIPGGTFFFTVALADRTSDLLVRRIDVLRRAWRAARQRHPFETIAVCILPEHLHAVWKLPDGDCNFALRWQQIKHAFSREMEVDTARSHSQAGKREKGVWQRRYWEHQIRDGEDLARHVDYIHFNPVKHGHVQSVQQWPHSSFHTYLKEGTLPECWRHVQAADARFGE